MFTSSAVHHHSSTSYNDKTPEAVAVRYTPMTTTQYNDENDRYHHHYLRHQPHSKKDLAAVDASMANTSSSSARRPRSASLSRHNLDLHELTSDSSHGSKQHRAPCVGESDVVVPLSSVSYRHVVSPTPPRHAQSPNVFGEHALSASRPRRSYLASSTSSSSAEAFNTPNNDGNTKHNTTTGSTVDNAQRVPSSHNVSGGGYVNLSAGSSSHKSHRKTANPSTPPQHVMGYCEDPTCELLGVEVSYYDSQPPLGHTAAPETHHDDVASVLSAAGTVDSIVSGADLDTINTHIERLQKLREETARTLAQQQRHKSKSKRQHADPATMQTPRAGHSNIGIPYGMTPPTQAVKEESTATAKPSHGDHHKVKRLTLPREQDLRVVYETDENDAMLVDLIEKLYTHNKALSAELRHSRKVMEEQRRREEKWSRLKADAEDVLTRIVQSEL